MASSSETGHTKNVDNFETLITFCTGFGPAYNPSNPTLKIGNLTTFYQESQAAIKLVNTTEKPFSSVEGDRQLIFKPLKPLATKVVGALVASGVPSTVIADAETILRKIRGKRADNKEVPTPTGETPKNKHSVSQQSYDMLIDHFDNLIELLANQPNYNPNEDPLKVASLIDYLKKLNIINSKVKEAYTPYSNAMIARDKKLYTPETGLVAISSLVKNYVKSVFGASSPEYKQVKGLPFRTLLK